MAYSALVAATYCFAVDVAAVVVDVGQKLRDLACILVRNMRYLVQILHSVLRGYDDLVHDSCCYLHKGFVEAVDFVGMAPVPEIDCCIVPVAVGSLCTVDGEHNVVTVEEQTVGTGRAAVAVLRLLHSYCALGLSSH
jgi:hypothetical protein